MAEVVLFEAQGHVVTNMRYVWGTRVIPLSDIETATPMVDSQYKAALLPWFIGLGMLIWGSVGFKLFGVLLLIGGVALVRFSTERVLVMKVNGEYIQVKFPTTELLFQVANAIDGEKRSKRQAYNDAMAADIASLPRANR